jgi:hypothetical protein
MGLVDETIICYADNDNSLTKRGEGGGGIVSCCEQDNGNRCLAVGGNNRWLRYVNRHTNCKYKLLFTYVYFIAPCSAGMNLRKMGG